MLSGTADELARAKQSGTRRVKMDVWVCCHGCFKIYTCVGDVNEMKFILLLIYMSDFHKILAPQGKKSPCSIDLFSFVKNCFLVLSQYDLKMLFLLLLIITCFCI